MINLYDALCKALSIGKAVSGLQRQGIEVYDMPLLSVRVPQDHPLWGLPTGQRSAKVREADLGLNMVQILNDIRDRLNQINDRLKGLEMCGGKDAHRKVISGPERDPDVIAAAEATFDLAGFSDI